MRKAVPCLLLLAFSLAGGPASAEPLRVTSGMFLLDIEGDAFTLNGSGFGLGTTSIGIYSTKLFPGRCEPSGFGFCAEREGALVDWSFKTAGGEQLLGRGNVVLGDVHASDVDFRGSMRINVVPTRLSSGGTEDFDFIAPFSFEAMIRGVQGERELFARRFVGRGQVSVNYEGTLRPGVFAAADETIQYAFSPAPVPEPATLLLLGSGLAGGVLRRRFRRTRVPSAVQANYRET